MNIKKIKVGKRYETKIGNGTVTQVGGTFPPTVKINITDPFPRGVTFVSPRDVLRELQDESPAP